MEIKTGIEEKRVKSTIIRRRAKAEPTPEPQESFASLPTREDKTSEQIVKVKVDESQKSSELAASPPIAPTSSDAIIISRPPPVSPASVGTTTREDVLTEAAKDKAKKATRRKTRDELEMEMIERAGGLKKVAEIIETAPERLERVFRPDRSSKKKRVLTHKEFKKTEITTPKATKRVLRIEGSVTVSD
ncbi:MAG: hypothetical protein HY073_01555, partial [Deltaproteobacteria bacterium]|nr:hypothetical protein [Deltaproteobacteria bacterium]